MLSRPAPGRRWSSPPRRIDPAAAPKRAETGIKVITVPENRWDRVDIKTVGLLPNVLAKQKAKAGRRPGSLVRRHRRHGQGRRLHQRLDRHQGRRAGHPAGRARHPARHHPHDAVRRGGQARARGSRSAASRSPRPRRRAKPSSRAATTRRHAGRGDRRRSGRQRPSRARSRFPCASAFFDVAEKSAGLITARRKEILMSRAACRLRRQAAAFARLTRAVNFGALACAFRGSAKEKKNGGTIAKSAGPVPELGSQEQEPTHDLPDQRRQTDGRRHLVRQFLRAACAATDTRSSSTSMPSPPSCRASRFRCLMARKPARAPD